MDVHVWTWTVPASRTAMQDAGLSNIGLEHDAHTLMAEVDAGGFVRVWCPEDDTVFLRRVCP